VCLNFQKMPSGVLFIHNLRLVPLEQQITRFRKALAQKAFALDTVGNFSVNIDFLDFKLKTGVQFFNLYRISGFAPELFTKNKTRHQVEGALSFEKAPCYYAINMCVCVKRRLSFSKS